MIGQTHKNIKHVIDNIITSKGTLNSIQIAYQNGERVSDGDFLVIMLHRLNMS